MLGTDVLDMLVSRLRRAQMDWIQIEEAQRAVCKQFGADFLASLPNAKIGLAISTSGQLPINGLRHPPTVGTSGWYIWCGESFSEAPDFFEPRCTHHFYDERHEVVRLLGLAPGWRFLLSGDYLDVWFDPTLLAV
jgi:hypothetical protein